METEIVFQRYQNDKYRVGWRDDATWPAETFSLSNAWPLIEYRAALCGSRNVRLIRRTTEVVTLESFEKI